MKKGAPRVLYLGDYRSGSAQYVLAALDLAEIPVAHHDATEAPPRSLVKGKREWDAILLSDYPRVRLGTEADRQIARMVSEEDMGLVMVGGWASFTGSSGGYRDSAVATVLPVRLSVQDDRRNIPTGLVLWPAARHRVVEGFNFRRPPVVVGYNAVTPRSRSLVVMNAWEMRCRGRGRMPAVTLGVARPMLVLGTSGGGRTAAFASDLAPHWCGGMVDWGRGRKKSGSVEVGDLYVEFIRRLITWAAIGETS